MNIRHLLLWCICCLLVPLHSCNDVDDLQTQANLLKERVTALEESVGQMNESVSGLQYLLSGTSIVGVTAIDRGYKLELADGQSFNIIAGENVDGFLPLMKISDEGYWMYSVDGTNYIRMNDHNGKPLNAYPVNENGGPIISPQMRVSADGYWQVSGDGGKTYDFLMNGGNKVSALTEVTSTNSIFDRVHYDENGKPEITLRLAADGKEFTFPVVNTFYLKVLDDDGGAITGVDEQIFPLAEKRVYAVEQSDVEDALVQAPEGWTVTLEEAKLSITSPDAADAEKTEEINIIITSSRKFIRIVTIKVKLLNSYGNSKTWLDFDGNTGDNVLLDFSYAGYKHGEEEAPSVETLKARGYKVYDVTDYGAVPNDGLSDREAFIKTLEAATGTTRTITADNNIRILKEKANAIIYFPEGEFVLQGAEDKVNECIHLTMGNFVIKGAGRNKTVIRMDKRNEPATGGMWSTPTLIEIKHYSDATGAMTEVTEDAAKGEFSVKVGATAGITAGSWVRLYLKNNDTELVGKELAPYTAGDLSTQSGTPAIIENGVEVLDYHQVKSVSGNSITFYEPLMHAVEAKYGWKIQKFPHYENIGVEDIAFQGDAKEDFQHHASAADDSGFKLIDFVRVTDSWMRRVNFISVSEALSVVNSANVSVYDVDISGKRGHSAIRSQGSSRVFIGKVRDRSNGRELLNSGGTTLGSYMENAGQYHACGVSKQSLGAVIWNVHWGDDSCFESHASQPRATLIDHCTGGFMQWREGGDLTQLPNHLDDLVIWNMNATKTKASDNNPFVWWDSSNIWWKNLPPVIVGFHGASMGFDNDSKQVKRWESNGAAVTPASLYEAQLKKRLGAVPAWLNALK